jgi:(p)ppGpp synthase/HD superfamily hydrolase
VPPQASPSPAREIQEFDRAAVESAFLFACEHHADQRRQSGEDFIVHPVGVAKICAGMRLDTETLCAAAQGTIAFVASPEEAR